MSLYQDFKNWITIWVLTFAFSFPKADTPRRAIHYLQMFLYRSRSGWIHKEESRGHWIAEDLKRNAKREAIADRISEANVVFLWIPGKHRFALSRKQHVPTCLYMCVGGGFRFDLGGLYTPTFATWIRALEADKNIKSMVFVADYGRHSRGRLLYSEMTNGVEQNVDLRSCFLQLSTK